MGSSACVYWLIIGCQVAFRVVLGIALAVRYLLSRERSSRVLLFLLPGIDLWADSRFAHRFAGGGGRRQLPAGARRAGRGEARVLVRTAFGNDDLLLLMRHRAALFGLLGGFITVSAFRDEWRNLAAAAGLVSMSSFMLLALPLSSHGEALQRVFWIDAAACLLLAFACWRHNRE